MTSDDGFRIIKIVHNAALTVSEYSHKKCVKDILIQYCKNKVKYSIKTSIAFAIFFDNTLRRPTLELFNNKM